MESWPEWNLWFNMESWPEWNLNPRPTAYHADGLPTELSGRRLNILVQPWSTESSDYQDQKPLTG